MTKEDRIEALKREEEKHRRSGRTSRMIEKVAKAVASGHQALVIVHGISFCRLVDSKIRERIKELKDRSYKPR